jgi:hypothetical protein
MRQTHAGSRHSRQPDHAFEGAMIWLPSKCVDVDKILRGAKAAEMPIGWI